MAIVLSTFKYSPMAHTLYEMVVLKQIPGLIECLKDTSLFILYNGLKVLIGKQKASNIVKYLLNQFM